MTIPFVSIVLMKNMKAALVVFRREFVEGKKKIPNVGTVKKCQLATSPAKAAVAVLFWQVSWLRGFYFGLRLPIPLSRHSGILQLDSPFTVAGLLSIFTRFPFRPDLSGRTKIRNAKNCSNVKKLLAKVKH